MALSYMRDKDLGDLLDWRHSSFLFDTIML